MIRVPLTAMTPTRWIMKHAEHCEVVPKQHRYEVAARFHDINVSIIDVPADPFVVEDGLMAAHSFSVADEAKP